MWGTEIHRWGNKYTSEEEILLVPGSNGRREIHRLKNNQDRKNL
jgi:hypothetical protein